MLFSAILFPVRSFLIRSMNPLECMPAPVAEQTVGASLPVVFEGCRGGVRRRPARSVGARAVPKRILERIGELCSLHIPHMSTAEQSKLGPQGRIRPVDQGGRKTIVFPHVCATANRRTERRRHRVPQQGAQQQTVDVGKIFRHHCARSTAALVGVHLGAQRRTASSPRGR